MSQASASCPPQCAETDNNKNTDDNNPETVQNTITNNSQVEEVWQRDLLKGLLTDNFCHVCEATLLFETQRIAHYEGKKHAQRVRLYLQNRKAERSIQSQECRSSLRGLSADPKKFCELCNMVFSSPTVARSHYEGKVHAKNMRKNNPSPHGTGSAPVLGATSPAVPPAELAEQNPIGQEQKDSSANQEVNVNDPSKYCMLCSASFNNPVVAQQHYSGRKHQRNQNRQQMLDQFGDQSEHVSSLTCPICCMTFTSIEMYQAHMQGNKHYVKEKKVMELCQSQKKVYDSYQDELADYIQVQKARGLEPKAGSGPVGQTSKSLNETKKESPPAGDMMPRPALMPQCPPPIGFHPPQWHPPFQSQVNDFAFRMRVPAPHYQGGYMPHPPPPFMPGQMFKGGRSPDSCSSSSFSDSSSYTSSSSSDSSSSYEKRRQRKMRKERKKRRYQEDECDTDRRRREEEEEQGERKRKQKGDGRESVEREEMRESRKWRKRRKEERSSSEDEQGRSRRRPSKRRRRHEGTHHAKRRKEEELVRKGEEEAQIEETQGKTDECVEQRTDTKDVKQKHKKEKKKGREKINQDDDRTEEERLWDETILGVV